MPALNFMKSMAPLVESGAKRQTIRRPGRFKVGDTIQLYTGQRTKACRKLGKAICTSVVPIVIDFRRTSGEIDVPHVKYNGKLVSDSVLIAIAFRDGFGSPQKNQEERYREAVARFMAFFEDHYGLPFEGEIIEWGDLK